MRIAQCAHNAHSTNMSFFFPARQAIILRAQRDYQGPINRFNLRLWSCRYVKWICEWTETHISCMKCEKCFYEDHSADNWSHNSFSSKFLFLFSAKYYFILEGIEKALTCSNVQDRMHHKSIERNSEWAAKKTAHGIGDSKILFFKNIPIFEVSESFHRWPL